MLTASAARSIPVEDEVAVASIRMLRRRGWTDQAIRSLLAARRWQRVGRAIVQHNGEVSRAEQIAIALINHGPRAVLTSFTAAERSGLAGWEREDVDVLVPAGARVTAVPGIRTHWTGEWSSVQRHPVRPIQRPAPALIVAASSFRRPRPACGILAAGVQQRLIRPEDLREALARAPRTRHHALLGLAIDDIAQGSQALSEIDFTRLCRAHGIPEPHRQAVRPAPDGRRRYLDAEWLRSDGRRVVVEVDGAIHLDVSRWVSDQLRQNEIAIDDDVVLRYPSLVVRTEDALVADQLRRALRIR